MKTVIIDNYDSFTYNLAHLVKELGAETDVLRNDKFRLEELEPYDKIILSPGPGIPEEAGLLLDVIRTYAGRKPMLGVCLGEQAIGQVFGGKLVNLSDVFHGVQTEIRIRDERLRIRDEGLRIRDEELGMRDERLGIRDEELRIKDERLRIRDEELRMKEEELRTSNEELGIKEERLRMRSEGLRMSHEELGMRDEELRIRNERLRIRDERLRIRDEELGMKDEELRIRNERLRIKDEELRMNDEELRTSNEELRIKEERLRIRNKGLRIRDEELKIRSERLGIRDEELRMEKGKTGKEVLLEEDYIFRGLPEMIPVGRYHSWVVDTKDFPDELAITAISFEGQIMALKHREYDIHGIQFHPESVLTPDGKTIVKNWLFK